MTAQHFLKHAYKTFTFPDILQWNKTIITRHKVYRK